MTGSALDVPATADISELKDIRIDSLINNIKVMIGDEKQSREHLKHYISKIETHLNLHQVKELNNVDREEIKSLILKHPYFKNPCNYNIRMTAIMKYLKKKGLNVNIKNIDLLVDEIIMSIDGIEKKGYDKYFMKK